MNAHYYFGEPPKWSKDVKFILVDVDKEKIELRKPRLGIVGDVTKSKENVSKIEAQLANDVVPFTFMTLMRIIRDVILQMGSPAPVIVSEGLNTMDVGRTVLVQTEPRTWLDAGTWGKIGVGLGYYIAVAIASPERLVVVVEGDFGFGFNAMEFEVSCPLFLNVF
ncbi:2-hydroxyacyl-CoA lyase [Capsicum annuum]|nr:2-hydroxyacyl-CoA lyase [Capsicum annuum]